MQGVKDMVVNTQKANIHKINILLESNMNKLEKAKEIRNNKESLMMETISAAKQWKMYLEEIINNNKIQLKNLGQYEANMNILRSQINKMNPMDHLKIKHIHEEALQIKHAINKELDSEKHYELEQSIRKSTVKINFEKSDELLSSLQAENDTIFMKLASSLESDPGTIFLTTHMLASIFTDKIALHNVNYKDRVRQARRKEGADSSLPLDDVSEYIEFINQHTKAMGINPSNNQVCFHDIVTMMLAHINSDTSFAFRLLTVITSLIRIILIRYTRANPPRPPQPRPGRPPRTSGRWSGPKNTSGNRRSLSPSQRWPRSLAIPSQLSLGEFPFQRKQLRKPIAHIASLK